MKRKDKKDKDVSFLITLLVKVGFEMSSNEILGKIAFAVSKVEPEELAQVKQFKNPEIFESFFSGGILKMSELFEC